MLRWLPLAFFAAAATLLGALLYQGKTSESSALIGKPFPMVEAEAFGKEQSLQAPARLHLYNLFASWCTPCVAEIPTLKELAATDGIVLHGIAWGDKPKALRVFLKKHGNPYHRVYRDIKGQWGIALGMRGVPETFVVDESGIVRMHIPGELKAADVDAIKELLP